MKTGSRTLLFALALGALAMPDAGYAQPSQPEAANSAVSWITAETAGVAALGVAALAAADVMTGGALSGPLLKAIGWAGSEAVAPMAGLRAAVAQPALAGEEGAAVAAGRQALACGRAPVCPNPQRLKAMQEGGKPYRFEGQGQGGGRPNRWDGGEGRPNRFQDERPNRVQEP